MKWLSIPGLVVVDECHHAITKSYTGVLRWLNAGTRSDARHRAEPPFIGLSATPFRMDDEESLRLSRRFDQRWCPKNQGGLYNQLLTQGYLARAVHDPLQTGITVSSQLIDRFNELSEDADDIRFDTILEQINQELAGNQERNRLLVRAIEQSEARHILFFANSVEHAQEIAARLCLLGIQAAAISGGTSRTSRRWFLDRFQSGEIRVLCNHSVLTTGFDAPRTDMVLIARQVKSPVRYMQMVGRGLRGPRNGGTEQCRILTVIDNLGRFQDKHPYHYCCELYKEN